MQISTMCPLRRHGRLVSSHDEPPTMHFSSSPCYAQRCFRAVTGGSPDPRPPALNGGPPWGGRSFTSRLPYSPKISLFQAGVIGRQLFAVDPRRSFNL